MNAQEIEARKLEAMREQSESGEGLLHPVCSAGFRCEWTITIKADDMRGAMDAVWECWQAWQKGHEPCGGSCPESMGNRMRYHVKREHPFPQNVRLSVSGGDKEKS